MVPIKRFIGAGFCHRAAARERFSADSSCRMRLVASTRRLTAQIECGISPIRVFECETILEQSCGNNPTALEDEFGLRTHENGTDLEHPSLCREAEPDATRLTKYLHELRVRKGIRRRDVHGSVDVIALDQPSNRRDEVLIVNPRHELPSVTCTAAEAVTY